MSLAGVYICCVHYIYNYIFMYVFYVFAFGIRSMHSYVTLFYILLIRVNY
jgi:hypothetical protein